MGRTVRERKSRRCIFNTTVRSYVDLGGSGLVVFSPGGCMRRKVFLFIVTSSIVAALSSCGGGKGMPSEPPGSMMGDTTMMINVTPTS